MVLCVGLTALTAGCAPLGTARTADVGGGSSTPAPLKILTIGIRSEPSVLNTFYSEGAAGANGVSAVWDILNNYLVVQDESYAWIPQLATEVISADKGSWRLNADGTMDTIWRIHPNVRWHDGQPFTADDLLFAHQVYRDPDIPNKIGVPIKLMESAKADDPQTFAIHWTQLYVQADQAPGLIALPRHILEPLSKTDKANFSSSAYFQTEFVGLGPYRLTQWERGSYLNLARHDGYFRGRPPLDTVIIRILENTESLVAHLLGGSVDVAAAVDIDSAVGVRQRWEAEGNIFMSEPSTKFRILEFQARPEFGRPTNGVTNPLVRQALYHAIDRPPLADVASSGLSPIADSWIEPSHELRSLVESAIPQYPYDPRRAQALLTQAGWTRGPDGIFISPGTGERLEIQVGGESNRLTEREQGIVSANWKEAGVLAQPWPMTNAQRSDPETRAKLSGAGWSSVDGLNGAAFYVEAIHSKNIAAPTKGWFGTNRLGYSNPRSDALLDRLAVSIAHEEQISLHQALLREVMGDVPMLPLYWKIDPILVARGISGVKGRFTYNIFEWDKK